MAKEENSAQIYSQVSDDLACDELEITALYWKVHYHMSMKEECISSNSMSQGTQGRIRHSKYGT